MYLSASTQQAYGDVSSTAGTVASVGNAAIKAGLSVSEAIPVVGTIIAAGAAILALFHVGQGCGQACITSAATEQIFEAAAIDVEKAAIAGMITRDQAVEAIDWLEQQGDAQMAQLAASDSKATAGRANMDKSIGITLQRIQSSDSIPASPTKALDANVLQNSIFITPGTSGWYANSVSQGASLALQAIAEATNLAAQSSTVSAGAGSAAPITTQLSSFFSTLTTTQVMVGLAVVGGIIFAVSGGKDAH